jgi:hypothetical protein
MTRLLLSFIFALASTSLVASEGLRIGPFIFECEIENDSLPSGASAPDFFEEAERSCPGKILSISGGTTLNDRYLAFVRRYDIPGGTGFSAFYCHEHRASDSSLTYTCDVLRTGR